MSDSNIAQENGASGPLGSPDPRVAIPSDAPTPPQTDTPSADPPDADPHTYGGVVVTCSALTYSVHAKGRELTLLTNVSLSLQPGSMTALLGPSGCGKTTLLDSLAGRKTSGTFSPESKILYDGRPASPAFLRRFVGYVEQFDTLLDILTVEEMLMYTAELKHPRSEPRAALRARVAALVTELGLNACAGTVVGSKARRGVSGGEAKRVNIGIALINDPVVLFLDELTSGLDSFTGHAVVESVRSVTRAKGITCVASIHAPSPLTFALFSRVAVLQRGRLVYFGPNGEAPLAYMVKTFPEMRDIRKKEAEGVADYLLDVTTRANADAAAAAALADGYAASALCEANWEEAKALEAAAARRRGRLLGAEGHAGSTVWQRVISLGGGSAEGSDLEKGVSSAKTSAVAEGRGGTVNPWWWALAVLWRYRSLKSYASSSWIAPRVGDKIMIVFLVVTVWWARGDDAIVATGILFLWSMLSAFTSMGILPTIVLERPVYRREHADGLFNPSTYAVYKLAEELAPQVPAGLVYSALVFYLVRLQGSFLLFWLVYLVSTANAIAVTCLVSALSPTTSVAGALASSYATTLFFFSGYLIPFGSIPVYWQWYAVIDPLRYSFGSMAANQFDDGGGEGDPRDTIAGRSALAFYDLEGVDAWRWLGYLAAFFPVYATWLWAALRWLQHTKR